MSKIGFCSELPPAYDQQQPPRRPQPQEAHIFPNLSASRTPVPSRLDPCSRLEGAGGHQLRDQHNAELALDGGLPRVIEADNIWVLEPL